MDEKSIFKCQKNADKKKLHQHKLIQLLKLAERIAPYLN